MFPSQKQSYKEVDAKKQENLGEAVRFGKGRYCFGRELAISKDASENILLASLIIFLHN